MLPSNIGGFQIGSHCIALHEELWSFCQQVVLQPEQQVAKRELHINRTVEGRDMNCTNINPQYLRPLFRGHVDRGAAPVTEQNVQPTTSKDNHTVCVWRTCLANS